MFHIRIGMQTLAPQTISQMTCRISPCTAIILAKTKYQSVMGKVCQFPALVLLLFTLSLDCSDSITFFMVHPFRQISFLFINLLRIIIAFLFLMLLVSLFRIGLGRFFSKGRLEMVYTHSLLPVIHHLLPLTLLCLVEKRL